MDQCSTSDIHPLNECLKRRPRSWFNEFDFCAYIAFYKRIVGVTGVRRKRVLSSCNESNPAGSSRYIAFSLSVERAFAPTSSRKDRKRDNPTFSLRDHLIGIAARTIEFDNPFCRRCFPDPDLFLVTTISTCASLLPRPAGGRGLLLLRK